MENNLSLESRLENYSEMYWEDQDLNSNTARNLLTEAILSQSEVEAAYDRSEISEYNQDTKNKIEEIFKIRQAISVLKTKAEQLAEEEEIERFLSLVRNLFDEFKNLADMADLYKIILEIKLRSHSRELQEIEDEIKRFYDDFFQNLPSLESYQSIKNILTAFAKVQELGIDNDYRFSQEIILVDICLSLDILPLKIEQKEEIKELIRKIEHESKEVAEYINIQEPVINETIIQRDDIYISKLINNNNATSNEVWYGLNKITQTEVAIKKYTVKEVNDQDTVEEREILMKKLSTVEEEIRLMKQLSTVTYPPCFLKFYGTFHEPSKKGNGNNCYYMMIEYCDKSLNDEIGTVYTELELYEMTASLLLGFSYLHAYKIYHLDIKLGNIMRGKDSLLKIIDFNVSETFDISKIREIEEISVKTGEYPAVGTYAYVAPEICLNEEEEKSKYNPKKADAYSLGITLLYLYEGNNTDRLNTEDKLPMLYERIERIRYDWLKDILRDMLIFDPDQRKTLRAVEIEFFRVESKNQIDFEESPIWTDEHDGLYINVWKGAVKKYNRSVIIKEYHCASGLPDFVYDDLGNINKLKAKTENSLFLKMYGSYEERDSSNEIIHTLGIVLESYKCTLKEEINDMKNRDEKYTEEQLKTMAVQLLKGFKHKRDIKIYHNDINLSNILRGEDGLLKIFNHYEPLKNSPRKIEIIQNSLQNDGFLPPEVDHTENSKYYPYRVDIYSLGMVLLLLYKANSKLKLNSKARINDLKMLIERIEYDWLKQLLKKTLKVNPDERLRSASKAIRLILSIPPSSNSTSTSVLEEI